MFSNQERVSQSMSQPLAFIIGLFLYFPEDKREYIPAGLTMAIFTLFAVLTMRFIIVYNRKQVQKAKELEEKLKEQNIQ